MVICVTYHEMLVKGIKICTIYMTCVSWYDELGYEVVILMASIRRY